MMIDPPPRSRMYGIAARCPDTRPGGSSRASGPNLLGRVLQASRHLNGGVRVQDVESTEGRDRLRDHPRVPLIGGDVGDDGERVATRTLDGTRGVSNRLGANVHAAHARTLLGEPDRGGATDPLGRPSDDRRLAGEALKLRHDIGRPSSSKPFTGSLVEKPMSRVEASNSCPGSSSIARPAAMA